MEKSKSLLLMALVLVGFTSFAQEEFTTYDNTYLNKTFNIRLSAEDDDKEKFSLYIMAYSLDRSYEKGGFMIEKKHYASFINALYEAKAKYQEWVKTAQDNNVKELSKEMIIKSKAAAFFHYGREWQFQFLVTPIFRFKIVETSGKTEYLLIVNTGELTSSSNQFMKVDGFILTFRSVEEIDTFTKSISLESINAFFEKPKAEELFKN